MAAEDTITNHAGSVRLARRGRLLVRHTAKRSVQAATARLMVSALRNEKVRTAVRETVSWSTVYDAPPNLLAVTRPSFVQARLLRYSSDDPQASVGRYCSLNEASYLLTGGNHHSEYVSTCLFYWTMGAEPKRDADSEGPIVIGNDVWSGFGSVVMPNVTVGDGAVLGAGAIVTRDVPPYAIVGGIPATIIGYRFEGTVREALLRIKWWDWPEAKVRAHVMQLASPAVTDFVARHDPLGPMQGCDEC